MSVRTVLVVEDSLTQSLHLQGLLECEGFDVVFAPNGPEGLRLASERRPDVIVLDLEMPGMNGFQVCELLKSRPETCDIPVVMLTRHCEEETARLGIQLGAVEYIPKDAFADAVLLETLRQMRAAVE